MESFKNKTIILGVPNHFGLPERFKENLEHLGFTVYLLEFNGKFSMRVTDKILHGLLKFFKKDNSLKIKKTLEFFEPKHLELLEKFPNKIDYSLLIRPDLFSTKVIKKIKSKTNFSVAYQWDGLDRFPQAKKLIAEFDRFFVFDVRDAENYPNCIPTTNFYFDDLQTKQEIKTDVFFVGTFMKNRIKEILSLSNFFKKWGYKTTIYLQTKRKKNKKEYENLIFIKKGMSFKENLLKLKESKVVLDFKNNVHYGLSFRTFETIGYSKKLITNNELVKNYDFYHPNNIFLLHENFESDLKEFLQKPYVQLPEKIVEKYSFTNWIKNLLT